MRHNRLLFFSGFLMVLSWTVLALVDISPPASTASVGHFFGSLFAQATLSAAWIILGPGAFHLRRRLALAWGISLPVAVAANMIIHGGPMGLVVLVGACLLGQSLLVLLLLSWLVSAFRLRLVRSGDVSPDCDEQKFRFGIRHLLIVMAFCGVLLGVGRLALPMMPANATGAVLIFSFLALGAIVMTIPLLLAALLRRHSVVGVALSLMLIVVATNAETPLMMRLDANGPKTEDFVAMNIASAIVVLLVAGSVRLSGYALFIPPTGWDQSSSA